MIEIKEITELKEIARQNLPKFIREQKTIKYACLGDGQAILDIDTTGLDNIKDEIISYCIIKKNTLKLVCRSTATEEELLKELKEDLKGIHTIISYTEFEDDWLSSKLDILYNYVDLFMGAYYGLGLHNVIKYSMENSCNGHDIPDRWRTWNECDFYALEQIARHTLGDALRKLALWIIDGNVRGMIIPKYRKSALIHDIICDAGAEGISLKEIMEKTGYLKGEIKDILDELIESGEICEKNGLYLLGEIDQTDFVFNIINENGEISHEEKFD
jgi:hypothetical protein